MMVTLTAMTELPITADTLTLTPNQRLALRIQEAFEKKQVLQGSHSWETPPILPLSSWLSTLSQRSLSKQLLSSAQEHYLWQYIIKKHPPELLLNVQDTARVAASAYQTLRLWNIPLAQLASYTNEESQWFQLWAEKILVYLKQYEWIIHADIAHYLIEHLPPLPYQKILLVEFDDLPPITEMLIQKIACEKEVQKITIQTPSVNQPRVVRFHNNDSEIKAAAYWAKEQLSLNPQAQIGIIATDLKKSRSQLLSNFKQIAASANITVNISAGRPLIHYPLIHAACSALHCLESRTSLTLLGNLLQSPYIHLSAQEKDEGAQFDKLLRTLNEPEIALDDLFRVYRSAVAAKTDDTDTPSFLNRLYQVNLKKRSLLKNAPLSYWKQFFVELLHTLGWPGYRILNSEEYQLYVRWQALLDEYTHYDFLPEHTYDLTEAIYLLEHLTQTILFQSEGSNAPIQIMGTLEAAGHRFDALWVMGLDNEHWPKAADPNPFIPYDLQRKQHMPHASSERELFYTKKILHRLTHSAVQVTFSYASVINGQTKQISPLLRELPIEIGVEPSVDLQPSNTLLESVIDSQGLPITDAEASTFSFQALKQQSDCPFKAFANIRMKALPLEQPALSLSRAQQGQILHEVLERIWQQLKSHSALTTLSQEAKKNIVHSAVDATIHQKTPTSALKQGLLAIEKERLYTLIDTWLTHEQQRESFSMVATELPQQMTIHNLIFKARIDRIDQLDSGEQVIIDYKTNDQSISDWFAQRPMDPQLLFYLCLNPHAAAICYAEISAKKCGFKGLAKTARVAEKISGLSDFNSMTKHTISWESQLNLWRTTINQVAQEFKMGIAGVTPQDTQKSCRYCQLKPFCRVALS